jgi:hypothetical protein
MKYLAVLMFLFGILVIKVTMPAGNDAKDVLVDKIFHAHYTANVIEDEIRKIRKEDYPLREKYEHQMRGKTVKKDEDESEE